MFNRMTDVVNKIERRLGTAPLNLPEELQKEHWADKVIKPDTLTTFSRFFPHMVKVQLKPEDKKDGYYLLDRQVPDNYEILGVKDILWSDTNNETAGLQQYSGYGIYNVLARSMDTDSIMLAQSYADMSSLFNSGIYLDFIPPNMVKLEMAVGGNTDNLLSNVYIGVFVKHPENLMTIEPTKMETFEQLAQADVATYLFEYLKHYDGIETVYANIDLKLSSLESQAQRRAEIIEFLRDNYVNPANTNQPIMYTV